MVDNNYEPPDFLGRRIHPFDPNDTYFYMEPPIYTWIRKSKKPLEWPRKVKNHIKWVWQKHTRGWSDRDAWNLDYFYADLIARSLREYKENRMGSPVLPKRDDDGEIIMEDGIPESVENPHEVWDEKLEKMIWAFEQAREVAKGDLHFDDPESFTEERWEERYEHSVDTFGEDNVMTRNEIERMKEGMRLFTDNFFALWD